MPSAGRAEYAAARDLRGRCFFFASVFSSRTLSLVHARRLIFFAMGLPFKDSHL
jgi:hypothetical protein